MKTTFSSIEQAVEAIARGEVVIVLDAENRENEGDFVCASQLATPEIINFMLHGRGQLCVSVLETTAKRCQLKPVVLHNNAPLTTAFLTPIDHNSCKTGITAIERSTTIRSLANPTSTATDFVRPGHVFPLLAKQGGVLQRAGHTEASMDLARLAGLAPSGVLCEILDSHGERPSREYLFNLASEFNLPITSIEQLAEYRSQREQLVHRAAEVLVPTKYGEVQVIAYEANYDKQQPVAFVVGNLATTSAPLVRVHSRCSSGDLFESLRSDCGDQLDLAMEIITKDGVGVIVCLPQEDRGTGLADQLRAFLGQAAAGLDSIETNQARDFRGDEGDYRLGMQVLKELGIKQIRLLANDPMDFESVGSSSFGIEVLEQVPILPKTNCSNRSYLHTSHEKPAHLIPTLTSAGCVEAVHSS